MEIIVVEDAQRVFQSAYCFDCDAPLVDTSSTEAALAHLIRSPDHMIRVVQTVESRALCGRVVLVQPVEPVPADGGE